VSKRKYEKPKVLSRRFLCHRLLSANRRY